MHRLTDDDLGQIEQALATLSGVAPRGWVVVDDVVMRVGNVKPDGTVGRGLSVSASSRNPENMDLGKAVAIVLNDAGRLLLELRRVREEPR